MSVPQTTVPYQASNFSHNGLAPPSPYASYLNDLPSRFEKRLKDLYAGINLPVPNERQRTAFLASATVELAPVLRNEQDVKRLVDRIGVLLSTTVPLSEAVSGSRARIMPKKTACAANDVAKFIPTETLRNIFSKDFRKFSAQDLKTLYDLAIGAQKQSVLAMSLGIAYAQARVDLLSKANPSVVKQCRNNAPNAEKPRVATDDGANAPLKVAASTTPRSNLVTLEGNLSDGEYQALLGLTVMLNDNRELIPVAQRSEQCWRTWPPQSSPMTPALYKSSLQAHPDAVPTILSIAQIIRNSPNALLQLVHFNQSLREVNPREPYYNGANRPPSAHQGDPLPYQYCYL